MHLLVGVTSRDMMGPMGSGRETKVRAVSRRRRSARRARVVARFRARIAGLVAVIAGGVAVVDHLAGSAGTVEKVSAGIAFAAGV
jgi:hypothetical protein